MPVWGSLYFQNACTPVMEQLIFFHDHVMVVLIVVMILVGYVLMVSVVSWNFNRYIFEGQELEMIWTMIPAVFLMVIALPSLKLLYMMEESDDSDLTIKTSGRQWYWVYEYADLEVGMFESYMIPCGEENNFRLLEVSNVLSLPMDVSVKVLISSGDVIHSWTVPSLGVSADGIPGRLNQVMFSSNRPGVCVGQCSEICGANHSFMPIVLEFINKKEFLSQWF